MTLTTAQIAAFNALTDAEPILRKTALGRNAPRLGTALQALESGDARAITWKKIALAAGSATTEIDTTYDLPAKSILVHAALEVVTAEATGTTKTIDVGLLSSESGGDADGFLDGISTAATGLILPNVTVTAGVFASTTAGLLLADFTAGTNSDDRGLFNRRQYSTNQVTAKSVSWTRGSAQTEFAGFLWLGYITLIG